MKAQEIMMFLLLFNLCLSLVGILHIYNIGVHPPEEYNVSDYGAGQPDTDAIVWRFLGTTLLALVAGAVAGAMTSWLTRIPTDAGIAYGIFTTEFWTIALNASYTIWQVGYMPGAAGFNLGIFILIVIFLGVTGVVFAYGLVQMIKGGWMGYK